MNMKEFFSVFELIQEFRKAQQLSHPTCSLDSQKRHAVGFYDETTKEWCYAMLNIVKACCYETNVNWSDVGLAGIKEVKDTIVSRESRKQFFGDPSPEILELMEGCPIDQNKVGEDTAKIFNKFTDALAVAISEQKRN